MYDPVNCCDPWGLIDAPASLPNEPGVYIISAGGKSYVGSSGIGNQGMFDRVSSSSHANAQYLLDQPDVKVQYVRVDLGTATSPSDRNNILRYYEQREYNKEVSRVGAENMLNDPDHRIQALDKKAYTEELIDKHNASASSRRTTCK